MKSSDTPEIVCLHEFADSMTLQASYQHNRSALPRNVPTNCGSRVSARGYRNREHFKTAIYFHLGGLQLYPTAP